MDRRRWIGAAASAGAVGVAPWPFASAVAARAPAAAAPAPAGAASAVPADASGPVLGRWTHGYAAFGPPKLAPDYAHFAYADPTAPKRGTVYLRNPDRRSTFDKYNPFTIRGQAPAGLMIFMFEPLAVSAGDELATMYGLLAEAMLVAPDRSSVTFRLHPQARFWNGDAVTAEDVRHSFEQLTSKFASPGYRIAYGGVERAVVVDERTLRFEL